MTPTGLLNFELRPDNLVTTDKVAKTARNIIVVMADKHASFRGEFDASFTSSVVQWFCMGDEKSHWVNGTLLAHPLSLPTGMSYIGVLKVQPLLESNNSNWVQILGGQGRKPG
eukprot:5408684-Amphidinium_carterae.1